MEADKTKRNRTKRLGDGKDTAKGGVEWSGVEVSKARANVTDRPTRGGEEGHW